MIIYFSATGNCKYVATRIKEKTDENIKSIIQLNKNEEYTIRLKEDETLGIITPTYFWALPALVEEYLNKIQIETDNPNPYIYVLSTYGTTPGSSIEYIEKILQKKGHSLNSKYSLKMVDTWTVEFDLTKEENIEEFTKNTQNKLNLIINSILQQKNEELTENKKPLFMAKIAQFAYNIERKTKKFTVDENCISCKQCALDCPINAIEIKENKPLWIKEKCLICFRCLHRCPTFSIEYDNKTRKNGQYTNPNITVFD